jgi:1A family penicillin-binding protein
MDRAPTSGRDPFRETTDTSRPTEVAPELGPALRALALALGGLLRRGLRRSRALAIAVSRRAPGAVAIAWRMLGRGLDHGAAALVDAASRLRSATPRRSVSGFPRLIHPRLRAVVTGMLWAIIPVLFGLGAFLGYCAYTLPLSGGLAVQPVPSAIVVEDDTGKAFATRGVFKGEPVSADQLPANLVHAVLAIEDRRFFDHPGIDLWGMARAAVRDLQSGTAREGASTITQQLVRLTYLSPERSIRRKVQEMMLAIWLETRLSKQQILARYLNTAYFGAGAYGADAAAKRYFNKDAGSLDLGEAAMLAGLIRAPSALSPTREPDAARHRAETVLQAMEEAGFISQDQAASARAHPARLAVPPETEPGSNYFVDAAEAEVKRLLGPQPTDLAVRSTFDPALQEAAERVVSHWLAAEGRSRQIGQAALVALAPDGAVLAMVGGRDYGESQFNRVTQARRQPGSLFKIFVYLAAFDAGYTPDSTLVDQPVEIGDREPTNYGGRFRGPVSLRTAFAQSINSISVQLVQQCGVARVIETTRGLGVRSELPAVPSLALGTAEVTLFEMTAAMDAIAANTKSIEPYLVRAIRTNGKTPLYTRREVTVETPSWNRSAMMNLLQAVVNEGTGKAARLARPVAAKTGTSQDYRDAWFVGSTTDFVVGVWTGNDDNTPMGRVVGGDLPAKIWHDFVAAAERIAARRAAPTNRDGPGVAAASTVPAPSANVASPVEGVPVVVDTATLLFKDQLVHLSGVAGENGQFARDMARYIGARPVTCRPDGASDSRYSCRIGDYDLAEVVLFNGGGRATPDASIELKGAEEKARLDGRGLWER